MKRLLHPARELLRDRPFLANNLIASGGTMATLFLSYLFHFVMTRLLLQSAYGDLSVLVSVFAVLTVPAASVSAALTRELSKLEAKGEQKKMHSLLFKYLKTVTLYSFGLTVLVAVGGWFVYKSMDLRLAALLVGLGVPAAYFHNMASSYFQAKENIFMLMLVGFVREVFRLGFSVILVLAGFGLVGASAAFPLGYILVAGGIGLYFWWTLKGREPFEMSLKRSFFLLLITSFLISVFMYLDLFFVKLFLGSASAGLYNVAVTSSKVLIYLAGGLVLVLFPKTSKLSYGKDRTLLLQIVWKSALFLVPVLAVFVLFAGPLVGLLYPADYAPAAPAMALLSVGMFFLALFTLLLNVMWSQNQEVFPAALLCGAVLAHAGILYLAVPAWGLLGAAASSTLVSFLLLALSALKVRASLRVHEAKPSI